MTPHDLAEALSDRLRTRGVDFLPEDVQTFTAGLAGEERGPDVEAMVDRFLKSLRDRAIALHNQRRREEIGWLIGTLFFGVGGLLLVGTALGLTPDSAGDPAVVRVIELVMAGGFLLGSAFMAASFRRSVRAWRASVRRVDAVAGRFIWASRSGAAELQNRKNASKTLVCGLIFVAVGSAMFAASRLVGFTCNPSDMRDRVVGTLGGLGLAWAGIGVTAAILSASFLPPSFWRSAVAWGSAVRFRGGKTGEKPRHTAFTRPTTP